MGTSKQKDVFGCDIGNGFGYISVLKDYSDNPISVFPARYHLDGIGMPTTAYIAPPDGSTIEVFDGRPAGEKHIREADKLIHAVKCRLKEGAIPIPGISQPVPVERIFSAIVRDLVKLGNQERKNRGEEPIYDIVFAFPASLDGDVNLLNRMQRSIEEIEIDGQHIHVVDRLPEPAAAAIDYLYYMQNIASSEVRITKEPFTALVYDLGHGTFDVAVVTVRAKDKPYELHISRGLPDVGGRNFDEIIYDEVCRSLQRENGYIPRNDNEREAILRSAQEIKHELTYAESSEKDISLPQSFGGEAIVQVSRAEFEQKSRGLIGPTFELVDSAIQQAKDQGIKIDAIVLSGGASQMPMVTKGLKQTLDAMGEDIPITVYRPSEAVSFGAARFGYGKSEESAGASGLDNQPDVDSEEAETNDGDLKEERAPQGANALVPPILDIFSEYSYGIWVPTKNGKGAIKVLVGNKRKLPAKSEEVVMSSRGGRLELRAYRSKEKSVNGDMLDESQCESIMFFPFDVPANRDCSVWMEVQEDYNVKIVCKPDQGKRIERSTKDSFT